MATPRRALLSVTDKTGLAEFARGLARHGFELVSTGGTARALREAGLTVTEVAEITGFPEILDGRVKTLHPKIHGGILARGGDPAHDAQLQQHGIRPIQLVVVNLYRFEEAAAKPGLSVEGIVEEIDIGGPALVRASAKNHASVGIVTSPAQYAEVLAALDAGDGTLPEPLRRKLAASAFTHTAAYDSAVSAWMHRLAHPDQAFPETLLVRADKVQDLRYGENPHQAGAFYRLRAPREGGIGAAEFLGGKELSYNNLLDVDSAFECVREFERPSVVIVKHTNPCGAGSAETLTEAFVKALSGDPVSAYGGVVALNRPLDPLTAAALTAEGLFFEVLAAPDVPRESLDVIRKGPKWGKNLRVLKTGTAAPRTSAHPDRAVRSIGGGLLAQEMDARLVDIGALTFPAGRPSETQMRDLLFAWTICKHVKSNAIVYAKEETVVGVGAGQMSRVDSAHMGARKAGGRAQGSVMASDAFFPFPDALEVGIEAGITAVIQPGGSIRDTEVIETAHKAGVPMVMTGQRHFRH